MSVPFRTATIDMEVHFGSGLVSRFVTWEKGPWLIIHEERAGPPYTWRHRLKLFPIVYGNRGHDQSGDMYAERFIEPFFAVKNGAVAAILFAHIILDMGEAEGFVVPDRWKAIANELRWELNYIEGSTERCERCYVSIETVQEWLKAKDAAL